MSYCNYCIARWKQMEIAYYKKFNETLLEV